MPEGGNQAFGAYLDGGPLPGSMPSELFEALLEQGLSRWDSAHTGEAVADRHQSGSVPDPVQLQQTL
ncbi:MAG: hypothetical protein WAK86_02670 [Pseudonocardiaceae bacterium]